MSALGRRFTPAGRAGEVDEDGFIPHHLNVFPLDDQVILPPQQTKQFAMSTDDQRRDLSGAGVHL